VKAFYIDILEAKYYWFRFEWQHRRSSHVHGVPWLQGAPDVEKMLAFDDSSQLLDAVVQISAYYDQLVSTQIQGFQPMRITPQM